MEKVVKPMNGYLALFISIATLALGGYGFSQVETNVFMLWLAIPSLVATIFIWKGIMIIQPNHSRVLNLFGKYVGSVKENGMFFVNPFYTTEKLTLRAQNLATPTLKVNDKMGNPIEIGAVLVWQIQDTYRAAYDVSDYMIYVKTQSEAAVRKLATSFAYDNIEDEHATITLRDGGDKVSEILDQELTARLSTAGIKILESRISHLAYAQEIAGAMLQRQQATAIVAARFKIVEGAVGMVEMALAELSKKQIVELDEEKKAAMVSNLMVVLCGEKGMQPVLNAGSLYQ
ncbi:SPFH domain-containing protein [Polluticoccus soli]|uniref:SPFH domain-containing protein n=1 Tax=Polluticoccus soli TaxID=3034150 RepID=UPI0023E22DEB|nr:SPFH domain-containing protein [Flavipsychrobacter sp. JY13-12]